MNGEDERYSAPDLFESRVTGTREVIEKLMKEPGIDLGCRPHPEVNADGSATLLVYADEARIAELQAAGYSLERGENVSELGRERRKEIGEVYRFEGGRVVPRGMGEKTNRVGKWDIS